MLLRGRVQSSSLAGSNIKEKENQFFYLLFRLVVWLLNGEEDRYGLGTAAQLLPHAMSSFLYNSANKTNNVFLFEKNQTKV